MSIKPSNHLKKQDFLKDSAPSTASSPTARQDGSIAAAGRFFCINDMA
jgi:hypothetical protein